MGGGGVGVGVGVGALPERGCTAGAGAAAGALREPGRRHVRPRPVGPDESPPFPGVAGGEEAVQRDVHEPRVAVVAFTVGEDELHRLGDRVDVVGAVVAEGGEVDPVEEARHLGQRRPLAPRPAGVDLDLAEARDDRLLDRALVFGEVLHRQPAAVLLVVADHGPREVAAVEGVAGGGEAGPPPPARGGRRFLVRHVPDRGGEVGLHETFAFLRRPSARKVDRLVRRPAAIAVFMGGEVLEHHVVHREPLARIPDRGRRDVAEAHRAVTAEGEDPGVGGGRHDGAEDAGRHVAVELRDEAVERGGARPPAEAAHGHHPVLLREMDHDRGDPRELHHVAVHHAEGEPGRHPGVDGVAARFEDFVAGLRREVVAGAHHVAGRVNGRLHGHIGGSPRQRGRGSEAADDSGSACAPARGAAASARAISR